MPELCPSADTYRLINSDTQAAFTSLTSSHNLSSNCTIAWQVYAGRLNSSIQWTRLENITQYLGRWFFGMLMSISVPVTLFSFRTECEKLHLHARSVSHLSDRRVLARPSHVFGWISEGIEFTRPEDELPSREWHLFSQSFEWNDQHVVHCQLLELDRFRWHQRLLVLRSVADPSFDSAKNLSLNLLEWTNDRPTRSLIGLSTSSSMSVRLPAGDHSNSTLVYLSVRVRDEYGCSFQLVMPPVSITRDTTIIATLVNTLQSVSSQSNAISQLNSNELVQLLVNGNQNEMNQVLVSISQMLNTINNDALQTTLMSASSIPATTLSVSSLDGPWTLVSNLNLVPLYCYSSALSSIVNECLDFEHEHDIGSCRIQSATESGGDSVGLSDDIRVQSACRRNRQHRSAIVLSSRTDQVDIGIDSRCGSKSLSHSHAIIYHQCGLGHCIDTLPKISEQSSPTSRRSRSRDGGQRGAVSSRLCEQSPHCMSFHLCRMIAPCHLRPLGDEHSPGRTWKCSRTG